MAILHLDLDFNAVYRRYNEHQVSQQGSSSWLPTLVMPGYDDMMEGGSSVTGSTFTTVVICVVKSTLKNKDKWNVNKQSDSEQSPCVI